MRDGDNLYSGSQQAGGEVKKRNKFMKMMKRQPVPFYCNKFTAVCHNQGIGPKVSQLTTPLIFLNSKVI